jgi:hypothetical protein
MTSNRPIISCTRARIAQTLLREVQKRDVYLAHGHDVRSTERFSHVLFAAGRGAALMNASNKLLHGDCEGTEDYAPGVEDGQEDRNVDSPDGQLHLSGVRGRR